MAHPRELHSRVHTSFRSPSPLLHSGFAAQGPQSAALRSAGAAGSGAPHLLTIQPSNRSRAVNERGNLRFAYHVLGTILETGGQGIGVTQEEEAPARPKFIQHSLSKVTAVWLSIGSTKYRDIAYVLPEDQPAVTIPRVARYSKALRYIGICTAKCHSSSHAQVSSHAIRGKAER